MSDEQSSTDATAPQWSRYERVKQILNEAAGEACPSYQGHERFWNLPHAEFLEVKLYGIQMVAPPPGANRPALPLVSAAPAKSCCHGPADNQSPAPVAATPPTRQPGRGAA